MGAVVLWATEDALDNREPDTLCALEIAVHPEMQRRGLSALVLDGMRANARELGYRRLIAPVRPPQKTSDPWSTMDEYAARRRPDGLPQDPWLRVHVRAGGQVRAIARTSATIAASLDNWRTWTGLPLDSDGPVVVPGGLVPMMILTRLEIGCYIEPNVWVNHPLVADLQGTAQP